MVLICGHFKDVSTETRVMFLEIGVRTSFLHCVQTRISMTLMISQYQNNPLVIVTLVQNARSPSVMRATMALQLFTGIFSLSL